LRGAHTLRHVDDDVALDEALLGALTACREALADYRAGFLDDEELRRVLLGTGVVRRGDEAWLLDVEGGHWHRWLRHVADGSTEEVT
jgi:hypothetical protein